MELQHRLSVGVNRIAENCMFPMMNRDAWRRRYPARLVYRSVMSTYSTVRDAGDKRVLRETQWVEATSVGWSFRGGESLRVQRKTNGQRTINLKPTESACWGQKINQDTLRHRAPACSNYSLGQVPYKHAVLRCQIKADLLRSFPDRSSSVIQILWISPSSRERNMTGPSVAYP